ncbi:MAG TPA: amidohydrolase family protein, partial [Saprospiraceae bacterium]|nr:amidohydrolase family protein [Saprospiraceae bacterium]
MKYFLPLLTLAALFLAASCGRPQPAETADLILINGNIYTVDSLQMSAQAIAVKGERILKVGSNEDIQQLKGDSTQVIDLEGKFLMPGFIEGHGHYAGLGSSLMNLNFLKSKSWDDIVKLVE